MELEERYSELQEIITRLDNLIDEITDKEYIEDLREIKWRAEEELEEIEPKLQEEYDREEKQQLRDYWNSVL